MAVDGGDGVGCVESGDGCSVVIRVGGNLCGGVAIVVGWFLCGVAATYFEGINEEGFDITCLEVVQALVDGCSEGGVVADVFVGWAKDE